MRATAMCHLPRLGMALVLSTLLNSAAVLAQTAPMTDASVADFERQLAHDDGPVTKAFRMTAPPDPRM